MTSKTAILLFSRSAAAEAKGKQLAGGIARNARLLQRMIRRTHRLAKRTGLPVFQVDERQQSGATFGERINHAARLIAGRGYTKLIILGNDAPQLRLNDLRRAQRSLEAGQSVLGPDRRGGAYLIGLDTERLGSEFAALPWQTEKLRSGLANFLSSDPNSQISLPVPGGRQTLLLCQPEKGNLLTIRTLSDLNSGNDLNWLLGVLAGNPMIGCLLNEPILNFSERFESIYRVCIFSANGRRGPPVLG